MKTSRSVPCASLPPRSDEVVGDLPESFRPSQLDYLPNSLCWYEGKWIASTNAWGDRRLGMLTDDAWIEANAPEGWIRRPMTVGGSHLCITRHSHNADRGEVLAQTSAGWKQICDDVEESAITDWDGARVALRSSVGHGAALHESGSVISVAQMAHNATVILGEDWIIRVPDGATVTQIAPSQDRSLGLITIRMGAQFRSHVISLNDGRIITTKPLSSVVLPMATWLDESNVVVVVERWPSLVPHVWEWQTGRLESAWPPSAVGTVRCVASNEQGVCLTAVATPDVARMPTAMGVIPASNVDGHGEDRMVVVDRGGQRLPCVVHEPPGACRGTAFYFPGGPHEPVWAEYAPLARAMNMQGWRVVRANVRTSGLRESNFRVPTPIRYGHDDVQDALAIIDALGTGTVVTLGMSYGGYLASVSGEIHPRCRGVAVLSGFLHSTDLDNSRHQGVLEFAKFAFNKTCTPLESLSFSKVFFVAHGPYDQRIPILGVRRHAQRCRDMRFIELTEAGHGIHTDAAARETYPALLDWLGEILN